MDQPKGILKASSPPTSSAYTVLPLALPPQRAFPRRATHYLYLRRDTPPQSNPAANAHRHADDDEPGKTEDDDGVTNKRSLFAANMPVDASEASVRALFARLDPVARVERVAFEGERSSSSATSSSAPDRRRESKKRRRPHDEDEDEQNDGDEGDLQLPSTWAFAAKTPGGSAVITFVDAAAAAAGLRAAKKRARAGSEATTVEWRGAEGEVGVHRESSPHLLHVIKKSLRIQKATNPTRP
jgi:ribosomal RNA-processing protein 7